MAGAPDPTYDPAGALARLGVELPNLAAARARTRDAVAARREALASLALGDGAAVVLFGSWGRGELTRRSDDDWAILVAGPDARPDARSDARPEAGARPRPQGGGRPPRPAGGAGPARP